MLTHIVREYILFDLIDRFPHFLGHLFQSYPDQDGIPNVIPHGPGLAALTALDSGYLFGFAVKLLNLPAPAAHLLYRSRRVLSPIVRHDVVRASGRRRDPEPFHFMLLRKPTNLDRLAMNAPRRCAGQTAYPRR